VTRRESTLETVIQESRQKGSIMPSAVLFGISVAFGLAVWGVVAWQYIWPALSERPSPENLKPILLLHAFRFFGLAFVLRVLCLQNYLPHLLNQ
jgi:hypothetical protein